MADPVLSPKLQISALWSYPDCLMTSGDIQYGVPTNVFFHQPLPPCSTHLLRHRRRKLARYTKVRQLDLSLAREQDVRSWHQRPADRTLRHSPLISRCSLPSPCRYSKPLNSSLARIAMYSSRNTPAFIYETVSALVPCRSRRDSPGQSTSRQSSTP